MSPHEALFGVKPKTGLSDRIPPAVLAKHEILTEDDLNEVLGFEDDETTQSITEEIDQGESMDTNQSLLLDDTTDSLMNSDRWIPDDSQPSLSLLPEDSVSDMPGPAPKCYQCKKLVGDMHGNCVACDRPVHGVEPCGSFVGDENDEGSSQSVICCRCKTVQV